jgi:hypothetical protein
LKISGKHFPIIARRITWALPFVFVNTWLTNLGGREGLVTARAELAKRGLRLLLDFVPNQMAPDHPWVIHQPEYFVQGNNDDARTDPASFVETAGNVFAHGRDPCFPPGRRAATECLSAGTPASGDRTLSDRADQCDGVRCDMAMLVINAVFERTWGSRAGAPPAAEYWVDVITTLKKLGRISFLLLRLIGTSSGNSNSRGSITVTTSAFMTVSNATPRRAWASIFVVALTARENWSALSKITMSLAPGQPFLPKRNALQPLSLPLSRVQNFFMTASWREERSGFLSSFEGAPLNLQTLSSGFSTARF